MNAIVVGLDTIAALLVILQPRMMEVTKRSLEAA